MKRIAALLVAIGAQCLSAQATTSPAVIMPAARLVAVGDSLTPGASRTAQLGRGSGYTYAVTHRDSTGGLEQHADWADVFVIEAGSASLLSGGSIEGGKETTPGELRGGVVRGAMKAALHVGDVVVIPAGTPHQMLLAPGEHVSYLAFKVARAAP